MAKTYNTFTNVATGDVYTAASHNAILTNLGNYRVPPMVRAVRTSAVSINNATFTAVLFNSDADTFDTDAMHDTVTNSDKIYANTAGVYAFQGWGDWGNNSSGVRIMALEKNGTETYAKTRVVATNETEQAVSALINLAVGDYVQLNVYQSSGGALNLTRCACAGAWLGQVS